MKGKLLRALCIKSKRYVRASDLCVGIFDQTIKYAAAVNVVDEINQRDTLSVVSEVFHDLNDFLSTSRGSTEGFRNYESRFEAQLAKFITNDENIKIQESITALLLLDNDEIYN